MSVIHESPNLGDLVKYEESSLLYSRDVATLAAGQNLLLGTVLGKVTATSKLKQLDPAATDGTESPVGILLGDFDASLIDRDDAIVLSRHAVVASKAVVWPSGITPTEKAVATSHLTALGILIRQSA